MRKSKLFLIFTLINFILWPSFVNAYTDIESLPSNVSNVCTKHSCWPQYNSKVGKSMRGMRVSLMKTDGTSVGQTYNIVADNDHYRLLTDYGNFIVLGSNCNKVQYEMGKCNVYVQTEKNWSGSPWKNGRLGVASAVSSYFSHLNIPVQSYLSNWNIDDIWQWADTEKLPISDDRTIRLLNLLFGLSEEQILDMAGNPDLLNDLWIVVEPITMLRYNYNTYLGTNYELAKLDYAGMLRSNITSVVGRKMPCSAMTTGDIARKYPDAPGVSAGSYFEGKLVYVNPDTEVASSTGSSTINQICSSTKKFKNGYPNSNKGVGVGLIYFRDLLKNDLSCERVNNGMSDYNGFMSKIDNAYKKGGLAGIYALPEVANGIKYTYNGEQKIADKTWYINECTCYGAYDTYKTSTGKEIYKLQKGNIMTIFDQKQELFKTFVDNIKNQVKIIEITNPDSVGPVTTWDYGKYESLGCGYIKSSCEEVNFDDMRDISASRELSRCLNNCPNDSYVGGIQGSRCKRKCYYDYIDRLDESNEILEQCRQLPLYPDDDFTTEFVNSNSDLYDRCFEYYNDNSDKYAPNWNLGSYIDAGCFPSDVEVVKKYNCTPRYNVGTCINGENVFYNDSSEELNSEDYWKYCVFSDEGASYDISQHKWSDHSDSSKLTYFDSNISSPYCEVYCIENLTGGFNSETIQVTAGQHFIWNDHSVSGSRTCKTKSIEWDKFTEDLKNKNNEIELAFNEYLSERDQAASYKETTHKCSYDCGTKEEPETCYFTGYNYSYSSPAYGSKENGTYVEKVKVSKTCQKSGVTFDVAGKLEEYNKIKNDSKKIYDQMKKCYNEDRGSSWISSMNSASGEGSSWDQWLYTVNPSAIIKYNYTINGTAGIYSVDQEMDKNITYTEKKETNDCQTFSGGVEVLISCNEKENIDITCDSKENCTFVDGTIKSCDLECNDNNCSLNCNNINYDCSKNKSNDTNIIMLSCEIGTGDSCIRQNLNIKKCTKVEMSKGANVEFNIPDGIYEYINKDGHTSFNADQFETLKSQYISEGKSFNYIYLGYSNFPVEYKTPDGLYGKEYGNGELSITYENLGNKLPDKKTDVDTILDAVDAEKYGEWQCQFEVVSELIPDNPDNPGGGGDGSKKGDINLIYRPIDLYNPFPDIDANGRNTGSNWCIGDSERSDCSNTNQNVQDYILNNRGVESHEIYSEEPMYTFILTPSTIKEIRRYNDNNSYADYYGSYSGKTFDFKCNEGTGRNCISDYLTYLIDITNAKNQPGVCVDDKYRTYNDPDNFDACRY